jgi:hypothetical protein
MIHSCTIEDLESIIQPRLEFVPQGIGSDSSGSRVLDFGDGCASHLIQRNRLTAILLSICGLRIDARYIAYILYGVLSPDSSPPSGSVMIR